MITETIINQMYKIFAEGEIELWNKEEKKIIRAIGIRVLKECVLYEKVDEARGRIVTVLSQDISEETPSKLGEMIQQISVSCLTAEDKIKQISELVEANMEKLSLRIDHDSI